MPRRIIFFFLFLIVGCSKNSLEYEEIPETLLFSCIDYSKLTDPNFDSDDLYAVSYTHLRAHETREDLVCRLLLEKKK